MRMTLATVVWASATLSVLLHQTGGQQAASLPPPSLNLTRPSVQLLKDGSVNVKMGSNVTLYCEGQSKLAWSFPDIQSKLLGAQHRFSNSRSQEVFGYSNESNAYFAWLLLTGLVPNDTGTIDCYYAAQPNVRKSLFLFVNSQEKLFVGRRIVMMALVEGRPAVLPCVPTATDVKVQLFIEDGNELMEQNDVPYDRKVGFKIYLPSEYYAGVLVCRFVKAGPLPSTQNVTVHVSFHAPTIERQPPVLATLPARRDIFVLTEPLELHCLAHTGVEYSVDFHWTFPRERENYSNICVTTENRVVDSTMREYSSKLTMKSVAMKDSGRYVCTATHNPMDLDVTTAINITIAAVPFVFVTKARDYLEALEKSPNFSLVVSVSAAPTPSFSWLKDGVPLRVNSSAKYSTVLHHHGNSNYSISLIILNLVEQDAGNYTVEVRTGIQRDGELSEAVSQQTTYVIVNGPPVLSVKPSDGLAFGSLESNTRVLLHCRARGMPEPEIEWLWQNCSLTRCSPEPGMWVSLTSRSMAPGGNLLPNDPVVTSAGRQKSGHATSVLSVLPHQSGIYRCMGKNKVALASAPHILFVVSEIADDTGLGFTLGTPRTTVIAERELVQITCYASLWLYERPSIVRKNVNESQFVTIAASPHNATIEKTQSNHSYIIKLTFDASLADSALYGCQAVRLSTSDKMTAATTTEVEVRAIVPPMFTVSLNGTNIALFTGSSWSSTCDADGMPHPTITWFKDNEAVGLSSTMAGVILSPDGRNLTIQRMHAADAGIYRCTASNKYGTITSNTTITIVEEDKWLTTLHMAAIVSGIVLAIFISTIIAAVVLFQKALNEKKSLRLPCELLLPSKVAINPDIPINEQTDCLPYDTNWEFSRERLRLGMVLGQGAFGRVLKAEAAGIEPGVAVTTVAVKTVRDPDNLDHIKALISELKILIHVGQHLNIVNLLGAVTQHLKRGELLVIVEYCCHGNLRSYLLEHKSRYVDAIDDACEQKLARVLSKPLSCQAAPIGNGLQDNSMQATGTQTNTTSEDYLQPRSRTEMHGIASPLTTFDLLCWCFQIARGMQYLASIQYIHRDMAARNVLLCEDNIVKICDFGLAKDIYKYNEYKKTTDGPLPIKWMALESLTHKLFTTASDVWSFGVTVWELFSLAATPYPGVELNETFIERLQAGYRMEQPKHAPDNMYNVMLKCWHPDVSRRPTFEELSGELGAMLQDTVRRHYLTLEEPYIRLRKARNESVSACSMSCDEAQQLLSPTTAIVVEDYLEAQRRPRDCYASQGTTGGNSIRVADDGYYNTSCKHTAAHPKAETLKLVSEVQPLVPTDNCRAQRDNEVCLPAMEAADSTICRKKKYGYQHFQPVEAGDDSIVPLNWSADAQDPSHAQQTSIC